MFEKNLKTTVTTLISRKYYALF